MRRVLVREQTPEFGWQCGVTQRNFTEQIRCLMVVLAAAPLAEAEPADGIAGSDASQDGQRGRDVSLPAVLGQDEFGNLEERSRLGAARATLRGSARDDATRAAGAHHSLRSSSRRVSTVDANVLGAPGVNQGVSVASHQAQGGGGEIDDLGSIAGPRSDEAVKAVELFEPSVLVELGRRIRPYEQHVDVAFTISVPPGERPEQAGVAPA